MALVADRKLRKTFSMERRPLMLKDYLLDDLSSCSSNGFNSFPRRQCCTTVRFLLEIDLKTRDSNTTTTSKCLLHRSHSALQRASEAVVNAVKLLPFTSSVKSLSPFQSPSPSSSVQRRAKKAALLPRSFSRKLLKRSFWSWRKADRHNYIQQVEEEHTIDHTNTIKPLKLFADFLGEQHQPSDQNNPHQFPTSLTPNSSCSSKSDSNSWTESDFTETTLQSSTGNFESSSENDTVEAPKHVVQQSSSSVSDEVAGSVGEDSINRSEDNTKDWGNDQEEKEQCSPVSVLDCPFEDDETDITSPFYQRLTRMEGTKQKLMQRLRRFESLARLEPVDLEKRMATLELEDDGDSVETLPTQSSKEDETEKKAKGLLKQIKSTTPSNNIILSKLADNLLLEFFREMIIEENQNDDEHMLKAAEDWIYGKSEQVLVGWEVEGGRKSYLRDMETNGRWRNFVNEEKHELALVIEIQMFTSLVNELVIDIF